MPAPVTLHPQLERDTRRLGSFEHSVVLLHRNAAVPWLILVPDTPETDFLALDLQLRTGLLEEAGHVAEFIRSHFGSVKINFAAIGNLVPQLHLHVVGRSPDDCCWPNPVWGHLVESASYDDQAVVGITRALCDGYRLRPATFRR